MGQDIGLITNQKEFLESALGCMLGLAVGDALGDAGRSDEIRNRYGMVTELYEGISGTDDTEFAILTARALLDCGGNLTIESVVEAWKKYVFANGGILERAGKPLYGAQENLKRGKLPPLSGIDNVMNNDDGAAMRVAPLAIYSAGNPKKAAELAEIDAQISHAGDGISAAKAIAASIAIALMKGSIEDIVEGGMAFIPKNSWLGRAMDHALYLCRKATTIEEVWVDLHNDFWTPIHSVSGEAIPQMYAIFKLTKGDFKKGLFWAANFGRDADTIAALIGALSGALHGVEVIPLGWRERVRYPKGVCLAFTAREDLINLTEELVKLTIRTSMLNIHAE